MYSFHKIVEAYLHVLNFKDSILRKSRYRAGSYGAKVL